MPNATLAKKWLDYAQTDYNVALHDTTFHPVPIEIICYHCEQAAEKALKAILAYHIVTRYPNDIGLNKADMKQPLAYAKQFIEVVESLWPANSKKE
jgi:HEPN domain-containing protein